MKLPTKYGTTRISIQRKLVRVDEETHTLKFERAMIEAAFWVNACRAEFKISNEAEEAIGDRWGTHPDRKVVERWLATKGAESDWAILYFVCAHIISEWLFLPKRTKKEHRKLFDEIDLMARRLAELLTSTGERYYRGGGFGLNHAFVCDLFDDRETADILATLENWNEEHPERLDDGSEVIRPVRQSFPDVETLLYRVAAAARRISNAGPIHSQPNKRGALNGFFVRRLETMLVQRYGEAPSEVLAAIASIALNVVIDGDLAKKSSKLSERSGRK